MKENNSGKISALFEKKTGREKARILDQKELIIKQN